MMKRRELLGISGALVTGMAGCLGQITGDDDDGNGTTSPDGDTGTPDQGTPTPSEPGQFGTAAWPTYQADPANTGTRPDAVGPAGTPVVSSRSDTWGTRTGPVVGDGVVYCGTGLYHERVEAFDTATGEQLWSVDFDDEIKDSLAVADGLVYVAADTLFALDARTGEERWTGANFRSPEGVTVADGVVYTASRDRETVYAFDAVTGEERWTRDITGIVTPAVSDGRLYLSTYNSIVCLDAETGETTWEVERDETVRAPATVGDDLVFVTTKRWVGAFDAETGEEVWTYDGNFERVSPALADGMLYLAGWRDDDDERRPRAFALDSETGTVEWQFEDEGVNRASPVVVDGLVYVPSVHNRLYALDVATGEKQWVKEFEWSVGTPAVADGRVFANVGGRLVSLDGEGATPDHDGHPDLEPPSIPPVPEYSVSDFYFGSAGYDVTASVDVTVDDEAPFDVSMAADGSFIDEDQAVSFEFEFENESDETLRLPSGAPPPLGVITLSGTDGTDGSITAWTDAYEDNGHVHTTEHRGVGLVNSIMINTPVSPGERLEETYTLSTETHAIQPGTYTRSGTYHVRPDFENDSDDEAAWEFEVRIDVELVQPAPENGDTIFDVAVPDQITPPKEFIGDFSVSVLEPVTDTYPGLIEISLSNETDERGAISSPGEWPISTYVGRAPDGSQLVLISEEMFAPGYVRSDGTGNWEPDFLPHMSRRVGQNYRAIDAAQTVTKRYLVLADPDNEDGLSAGNYTFKQGYADENVEFTWGFLLSLFD
jgi:outer membrane protein assembly factor BamB